MTIAAPARTRRCDAVPGHAYTVPVVRELPSQPADLVRGVTW
jgi:hypothetical protein